METRPESEWVRCGTCHRLVKDCTDIGTCVQIARERTAAALRQMAEVFPSQPVRMFDGRQG